MAQQLVYYLSSAEAMQADSVDTPERELLVSAAAARGIHMRTVAWDQLAQAATQAQTSHPPAWALVRSTWDYHERLPEFLAAMGQLEASGYRLLNPLPVLQWNAHKKYLAEFAAAADANAAALGHDSAIRTISTIYAATPDAETVFSAMDSFGVDDVIVKPAVGAGAWRQARVRRGDPLPDKDQLPLGQCLIQPFHAPIEKFGEYSFIFFNNQLAYAVHKQPPAGEYRTQPYFGTSHHTFLPSAKQLEQVQRVLARVKQSTGVENLLYARVDMARAFVDDNEADSLVLMEVELLEPHLYLLHDGSNGQQGAEKFVHALLQLIRD